MTTIRSPGRPSTRIAIGRWHSNEPSATGLPHPQGLVSQGWEPQRRAQIVDYLRAGGAFRGGCLSYCMFGCRSVAWKRTDDPTQGIRKPELDAESPGPPGFWIAFDWGYPTGCLELTDGMWSWPEGLAHYVETHGVRLPDEFVAYAASQDFRAPDSETESNGEIVLHHGFWNDWCLKNARFEYEPNCAACQRRDSSPNPTG